MEKLKLTQEEIEIIEYVRDHHLGFPPFVGDAHKEKIFYKLVDRCDALLHKLKAYEELSEVPKMCVLTWYYNKYLEQQAQLNG
ncbi:MAG: hypothetical protein J5630_00830 [Bacteroidaceae bacterium]|nr:hypothetical protein [Bacteroidaceae bacterium]